MSRTRAQYSMKANMGRKESTTSASPTIGFHDIAKMRFSEEEILGSIVNEILVSGKVLSRKSLCYALLARIDQCEETEMKHHYAGLFKKIFSH
ncbi:biofilm development regulator YmgB/AriR family protein [Pantoea eucrina]|uniref:Biofilm development regulator YmgB/AriR family protein n=1 Tax=Pantoea eucrina TaxID=472693 RepID=A0ABU5LJG4_9GAMM|nr:biofilm development regulator YmgB/AriR family protein [Pantoea eucrina]MDZ7280074.1 biofilm development regulator YmgB/AriR family protein [Pantoea eucrina]